MADGKRPPVAGEVQDGYRFLGGDPGKQESWLPVDQGKLPEPPAPGIMDRGLGTLYEVATKAPGIARSIAPAAAATAAGIADPLAAPITSPLAYAATEGLVSPEQIQQHPVREGLAATTMAIPGPAEAASWAFPKFAVEHPGLMRAGGTLLGGLAGGALGERSGGGHYGELGGGIGGAFLGYRLAGPEIKSLSEGLVKDVIAGKRPFSDLPPELVPMYNREAKALADAYAQRAIEQGITPETISIPSGIRKDFGTSFEERARQVPIEPSLIATPEEAAASEQKARAYEAATQGIKPEARLRGMTHAAGRQSTEWVPSKRGSTSTLSQSFRVRPKLSITER